VEKGERHGGDQKMKSNVMREILIKKGTDLFYKEGFARSSIRDIGRIAGISSSTLYHYFKDKDELLYEVITLIGNHLLKVLNNTIQEFADPEERLKQMVFRQICVFKEKKKEVKVYIEEQYQLPPRLRREAYLQQRKIYDTYLHQLELLQKRGRLRINHLPTINFTIFATINWVYRWFKEDGPLTIEELAEMIITILFNGILSSPNKSYTSIKGKARRYSSK
jgi:AcrR family transcriptional regulator